jgi:hypothetical protein
VRRTADQADGGQRSCSFSSAGSKAWTYLANHALRNLALKVVEVLHPSRRRLTALGPAKDVFDDGSDAARLGEQERSEPGPGGDLPCAVEADARGGRRGSYGWPR